MQSADQEHRLRRGTSCPSLLSCVIIEIILRDFFLSCPYTGKVEAPAEKTKTLRAFPSPLAKSVTIWWISVILRNFWKEEQDHLCLNVSRMAVQTPELTENTFVSLPASWYCLVWLIFLCFWSYLGIC